MNDFSNTSNGAGLLKDCYPGKGDKNPMIQVIRKKRDLAKKQK